MNDGGESRTDQVIVRRLACDGAERAAQEATVTLGPGDSMVVVVFRIDPAVAESGDPAAAGNSW